MQAALQCLRAQQPHEVIVAVPVAAPGRLEAIEPWCDEITCLLCPEDFHAVGEFYRDFRAVEDAEVLDVLRDFASHPATPKP
jgi:predicted phosphoribosyltransferase